MFSPVRSTTREKMLSSQQQCSRSTVFKNERDCIRRRDWVLIGHKILLFLTLGAKTWKCVSADRRHLYFHICLHGDFGEGEIIPTKITVSSLAFRVRWMCPPKRQPRGGAPLMDMSQNAGQFMSKWVYLKPFLYSSLLWASAKTIIIYSVLFT